ncbi:MAG: hypothetical protein M3O26_16355, partial [Pseudomonadota bacterium]|nr:hypothetical protein [Pseudomonadota bacterium]
PFQVAMQPLERNLRTRPETQMLDPQPSSFAPHAKLCPNGKQVVRAGRAPLRLEAAQSIQEI